MAEMGRNRDYPIPQAFYVHVRERTKGTVSAFVGPNKLAMSDSEDVVVWEQNQKRYQVLSNPEEGIRPFTVIGENQYCILTNPAPDKDNRPETPRPGASSNPVDLRMGEKVILHGPQSFALWPMQSTEVVDGHTMKSNEYILVEVIDTDAAVKNWDKLITKTSNKGTSPDSDSFLSMDPQTLVKGQRIVVRGTEVSFFMPVTGLRVVADENRKYIREAVTLEMLEYCILLDENGSKRFIHGPDVVFPRPTEEIVVDKGSKVFRAIELSSTSGVHVKVTQNYTDGGREIKAGEELFITGSQQPIYFPRAEHAIIEYESVGPHGNVTREKVHYASAVPKGHGRYVLNRDTGDVTLKVGPTMLLLNPAKEVIVQRVLSEREVNLWFPNNEQALQYNQRLAEEAQMAQALYVSNSDTRSASFMSSESVGSRSMRQQLVGAAGAMADSFARKATFTPPKTVKLDDRFTGAVSIGIWPGYAIQVVDKSGDRRVEVGPKTVLLQYSEDLTQLGLSTGKPKTTDNLFNTVYLKVRGNQISDIINVSTSDHVEVEVKIAYQVNFNGDPQHWFDMENYVKLICDFNRSVLKGKIRNFTVHELTARGVEIIRDAVLGEKPATGKRAGRLFEENGAHIYECEVLSLTLKDKATADMITASQRNVVQKALDVSVKEASVDLVRRAEKAERAMLEEQQATAEAKSKAELEIEDRRSNFERTKFENQTNLEFARKQSELDLQEALEKINEAVLRREKSSNEAKLEVKTREREIEAAMIEATTAAIKERLTAISPDLAKALNASSDNETMIELAKNLGISAYLQEKSVGAVIDNLLKDSNLSGAVARLAKRA